MLEPPPLNRRRFVTSAVGVAGLAALAPSRLLADPALAPGAGLSAALPSVDASAPGGADLYVARKRLRIAGAEAKAIALNGGVPGPVVRMKEGAEALIRVHNDLEESTSVHWHGLIVPYTMDGVPGISYAGIEPGSTFEVRFPVRQAGTYWYHSHTELQEQVGHYGMIVVEPAEPAGQAPADVEHPVVLSDWTFQDPHRVLDNLKTKEGYYNFQKPTLANLADQARREGRSIPEVLGVRWSFQKMRMDPTDLADVTGSIYTYLVNGRGPDDGGFLHARPGQRVRLRVANASAMTFFDVRVVGSAGGAPVPLTVVAADGHGVEPVEVSEFRIGVAETYDVLFTVPEASEGAGPLTLFCESADRSGFARATIGTDPGRVGPMPARRERAMLTMADMGMKGMDGPGGMAGMDMSGGGDMEGMEMSGGGGGGGHDGMDGMAGMDASGGEPLPVENLPDNVMHGPDDHGPGNSTVAMVAYRRSAEPGTGLGSDGWRVLTYADLRAAETYVDRRPPTRELTLHLTGNMGRYIWGFDGKKWSESKMVRFVYGERLRINYVNDTMMPHPMHLHGMWSDLHNGQPYEKIPRKHTTVVQPAELLSIDVTADAPGHWAFHCHLLYHMEVGMFRTVAVVRSLDGEAQDAKS